MASCAACGTTILFGGTRAGDFRFCNEKCLGEGRWVLAAAQVPEAAARQFALTVHASRCPQCQGPGPVDVHRAYRVWSAVVMTQWQTLQQVSCRACARKRQALNLALSLVVGWWGFPWGLVMTPVQVVRNLRGMLFPPSPVSPSEHLVTMAKTHLAKEAVEPGALTPG